MVKKGCPKHHILRSRGVFLDLAALLSVQVLTLSGEPSSYSKGC